MNRHSIIVAVLWLIFTIAGVALVLNFSPFPPAASAQAHVVDDAFKLLTILAVPVFAFVVAMLLYSMVRFGQNNQPDGDGPPIRSNKGVIVIWLLLSTALTVVVIIHPGITGILELRADGENVDLIVEIEGRRFGWTAKYPGTSRAVSWSCRWMRPSSSRSCPTTLSAPFGFRPSG